MEFRIYFLVIIFSGAIIYFTQKIFIYFKKFDDFNHRSSHKTLATRTGGIAVFTSLLMVSLFYYFNRVEVFDYSLFIPLGIMFIVGVYDDFYHADFKLKFLLQIIVAKIIIDQGYVISNFHGLFGLQEIPWFMAQLTTIFVFLVIVNAFNFIDGIDGLAITEIIKVILLIELFSAQPTGLFNLGMFLITSLIPLYYFNFKKKRKVFLGDGGSLLLGTIVSIYIFYVLESHYVFKSGFELNKIIFTVFVILYPLVDLFRVFILRINRGKSPFIADQNHLHHILFKNGVSTIINLTIIQSIHMILFLFLLFFFIKF